MIAVVDYGVNNLASVVRAFAAVGHPATLTADPEVVRRADRVVLPGVGNFGRAAVTLRVTGLGDAVREQAAAGRPVLGICLGQQLFFAESEEAPGAHGLGILPGRVARFTTSLHVPHVGWAEVLATTAGEAHPVIGPLLGTSGAFYYHVHSFHPADLPDSAILATADYDGRFPTIVGQGSVLGTQFHPEKSQDAGLALVKAFAEWTP
ncbi:MAG: imidazole glycerol phosphate synthase subunit HisH [Gemmatimonadales bacterium]